MRFILLIFLFSLLVGCSKPKTVLICGDHVCINKAEAEKYFEENLSIEVKIIEKKNKQSFDLVELNMRESNIGERKISVSQKENTDKDLKVLSKEEISTIKEQIKKKKDIKKIVKKETIVKDKLKKDKLNNIDKKEINLNNTKKNVNKKKINIVDVCTVLKKCSIEEISKYLIKKGNIKKFPDITIRQ